MKRRLLHCAVFALFIASSAQVAAERAPVPPPALPTLPPPVTCIDDNRVDFDPRMRDVKLCLIDMDGETRMAAVNASSRPYGHTRLTVELALNVLSVKQTKPLWPTVLKIAGNDLEKLRKDEIAWILQRKGSGELQGRSIVSLNQDRFGTLIAASMDLVKLGEIDLAQQLLDGPIAEIATNKKKKLPNLLQWRWYSLAQTRAMNWQRFGQPEKAIAELIAIERNDRILQEYRLNATVNLAAIYAETGRFAEALKTVEAAEAQFFGSSENSRVYKLGGSNRQFAWIHGCALAGLGRKAEATPYIESVQLSVEQPGDAFAVVQATSSIKWRMAECMHDLDALKGNLVERGGNATFVFGGSSVLQNGYRPVNIDKLALYRQFRADPVIAGLSEKVEQLPTSLMPALNGWRPVTPVD